MHTSPKRRQMFLDICESESLKPIVPPLDCDTRWNSTFLMLQSVVRIKNLFFRMKDRDKTFPDIPDDEEWKNAEAISNILKPFYECMKNTLLYI